jgi:hypothetical protein
VAAVVLALVAAPEAKADHRRCYGGGYYGGGGYYSGYGGYGGGYYSQPRVSYYYGDPYHRYSSPSRVHYGPHSNYHVGPVGGYYYGSHSGRHYDLHGGYGHHFGL